MSKLLNVRALKARYLVEGMEAKREELLKNIQKNK